MEKLRESEIELNIPPPTISGTMHMGHAYSYLWCDFIGQHRSKLMFDDNGIPTQKLLKETGKPIEYFYEKYTEFFKDLKVSFLPENIEKTIDQGEEANKVFSELKEKGLIYFCEDSSRPVWYDPIDKTTICISEIIEKDGEKYSERSGAKLEKITEPHWYLKMTPAIKEKIVEQSKNIKFYPENGRKVLDVWLDQDLKDWCISRKRDFGVKIEGSEGYVFDTWFISSLIQRESTVRIQGKEIIRTWLYYSLFIRAALDLPFFEKVVLTGWCINNEGEKLSKSKGTDILLKDVIEKYGLNAVRYWAAKGRPGENIKFCENTLRAGRKLDIKIKNAIKFVEMFLKNNMEDVEKEEMEWLRFRSFLFSLLYGKEGEFLFNEFLIDLYGCGRHDPFWSPGSELYISERLGTKEFHDFLIKTFKERGLKGCFRSKWIAEDLAKKEVYPKGYLKEIEKLEEEMGEKLSSIEKDVKNRTKRYLALEVREGARLKGGHMSLLEKEFYHFCDNHIEYVKKIPRSDLSRGVIWNLQEVLANFIKCFKAYFGLNAYDVPE